VLRLKALEFGIVHRLVEEIRAFPAEVAHRRATTKLLCG
jgi:hypothetical protein